MARQRPNRLIDEKSPYLLQHAYNPVDWYPWGEEAFEKAKNENKPIFLSIGYSTCHWCHVMNRESFEDKVVAKILNKSFICVKVDREERPEVDKIYLQVSQVMTGNGGWPLTIIMTQGKKPFFAGTYIPKETTHGTVGLIHLLPQIKQIWKENRKKVIETANEITQVVKDSLEEKGGEVDADILDWAYKELERQFDDENGGFGFAPKFPIAHNLYFLLRYWRRTGNKHALHMVEKTLIAMRHGAVYDQLGFGFHRYTTDSRWLSPHFEKMLYDQALLAIAYLEAYQATKKVIFRQTAKEIFDYVTGRLLSPQGGFYSAEDAETEEEEGRHYLWTEEEIRKTLSEEAELAMEYFNIKKNGNFYNEDNELNKNVLYTEEYDSSEKFEKIRMKLLDAREKRAKPDIDEKVLTDWNGLMIAALAMGARVLREERYSVLAIKAAKFILREMHKEERLLHSYAKGEASVKANADDYAFLIWGLIELFETTFDLEYLGRALALKKEMIKLFWDNNNGGFFFTPKDYQALITRQKEVYDGAIPSANSVSLLNLIKLARITGEQEFEEKVEDIVNTFARAVKRNPSAYTHFLSGYFFLVGPSYEIVVSGKKKQETEKMINAIRREFVPNKILLLNPDQKIFPEPIRKKKSSNDKVTAYVCKNYSCREPTTDIDKALELLNV
jgi:uncharacterized protein